MFFSLDYRGFSVLYPDYSIIIFKGFIFKLRPNIAFSLLRSISRRLNGHGMLLKALGSLKPLTWSEVGVLP